MPDDIRERLSFHPDGQLVFYSQGEVVDQTGLFTNPKSTDVINALSDHSLWVTHSSSTDPVNYDLYDWPEEPTRFTRMRNFSFVPFTEFPNGHNLPFYDLELNSLANRVLVSTNPSRPNVSLPVFLGEFRELPSQIYDRGKKVLKSNTALGIKFGILPMASDVLKLMRLSEFTDRRLLMLKRLFRPPKPGKPSGCRMKRKLRERRKKYSAVHPSFDFSLTGVSETYEKVWGTAWWTPNPSYEVPSLAPDLRDEARRLVLGIGSSKDTGYIADTWELLPWSWFADWFGNFSDHLDIHLNQAVATASQVWLMQHLFTSSSTFLSGHTGVKQSFINETKRRQLVSPQFEMTMPILSVSQVSILTDLIVGGRYRPSRVRKVGSNPPTDVITD